MSEEQAQDVDSVEPSTAAEASTTTGTAESGQNAGASTESPQSEVTTDKTGPSGSGQKGGSPTPHSGTRKAVLNERTFMDRILDGMFPSSLQRLRNALPGFAEELKALKERDSSAADWKTRADNLLDQAIEAANARDAEKGWQCLNAAGRFALYGLDDKALRNQAIFIANTAADDRKGLPPSRRDSIYGYLKGDDGKLKASIPVEDVVEAKRILDEHNDNVYRRLSILKSRLLLLTMAGLAFLVIWLFFLQPPVPAIVVASSVSKVTPSAGANATAGEVSTSSASPAATVASGDTGAPSSSPAATKAPGGASTPAASPAATEAPAGDSDQQASTRSAADTFWWMVVLAGLLGGLISAFTSAIRSDIRKSNIPAELSTQTVTFARLMLAALSALAITLFLTSGLLSFEQLSYELILAIAIVSGFTERLLLRAVDQVAKTA